MSRMYPVLSLLYLCTSCYAFPVEHSLFQEAHSATKSLRVNVHATEGVVGSAPEVAYGTNNGLAWKAPVVIGGQTLELMMDTGSYYPWVLGPNIPENRITSRSYYDPSKSESFVNGTQPFSVAYIGDFGANGYEGYDTITIGNLTVQNTAFGVATEITGDVIYTGSDGIIGLEPFGTYSPLITAIFNEVEAEILTFDLRNDSTGTVDFGYVDSTLFQSKTDLTTVPLNGNGWELTEVSFAVGGKVVGSAASGITLDTGGEVIAVDNDIAEAYWASLVASGTVITTIPGPYNDGSLYVVPCTTELPDLTIIFGDPSSAQGNATILGETIRLTGWPRGDGSCIGAVWAYPESWIGAPFFYQYAVAMDYGSKQVTFGAKAGS